MLYSQSLLGNLLKNKYKICKVWSVSGSTKKQTNYHDLLTPYCHFVALLLGPASKKGSWRRGTPTSQPSRLAFANRVAFFAFN